MQQNEKDELRAEFDAKEAMVFTRNKVGIPIDLVESGEFVAGTHLETPVLDQVS